MLRGMWNHFRQGIEPLSPVLAGGFFTTEPPGKSSMLCGFFFFLNKLFLFGIGVEPVNSFAIVSGEQQRDSAIHSPCFLVPPCC